VESFVSSGGVQLWTCSEGDGPAVVCVSGGPGCCDYLGPVAALLRPGFQTVRFDARGCGRSSATTDFTLENSLADLEAIRDSLGIQEWSLLGHSAGCETALAYAMAHPRRTRAIVCLAGGRFVDDRSWHRAYATGRDDGLEPPLEFDFPPNMEANQALNAAWKEYIHRPEMLKELAGLSVPALFVYGSEDIRPSWPVEQVAALLPNAEFQLLRGANHYVWQTHREEVRRLMRGFLGGVDGG
jgi:proline iminopeptidase